MLGRLDLTIGPRVAVGFTDKHRKKTIKGAIDRGLDIAELRIDLFSILEAPYIKSKLAEFSALATIGTIRSEVEGGKWTGDEGQRLSLFREIVGHVDSIDIELGSTEILSDVAMLTKEAEKTLIISHHDFIGTPERAELDDIVDRSKGAGADIVKISTMVNSFRDIQLLADLTMSRESENLVVIGMGSIGLISRLVFPSLGSLMTYAFIGEQTAPGQIYFEDMVLDLRRYYSDYNQRLINDLELMEYV